MKILCYAHIYGVQNQTINEEFDFAEIGGGGEEEAPMG